MRITARWRRRRAARSFAPARWTETPARWRGDPQSRDAGRWQHGMLRGAWRKPDAEYLGHHSREEALRRRIAELEAILARIDESIAMLDREIKAIEARAVRIARERSSARSVARLQRAAHELETRGICQCRGAAAAR